MGGSGSKSKNGSPVKSTAGSSATVNGGTAAPADGMPNFAQARQPSIGKRPAVIPKIDSGDSLAPPKEDDDNLDHNEVSSAPDPVTPASPTPSSAAASAITTTAKEEVEVMVVPQVTGAPLGRGAKSVKQTEEKTEKLFAAPKGPERSKIWQALNPDKLYYESAREKAEAAEEKEVLTIRGGGAGSFGGVIDYARARDEEGNLIEEEPEEPEEPEELVDPKSLPELDPETLADLARGRAERAEKEKKRQEELRARFLAKKAEEERKRQEELKRIREIEAARIQSKPTETTEFVEETLNRIDEESKQNFRNFSFKT